MPVIGLYGPVSRKKSLPQMLTYNWLDVHVVVNII